ncbi:CLUMA_CG006641, isoform A [Clunio marinus]|uniref:CLUMA_CG006641, isoform A n=1 Tax=Clunio marinus TaxID=568069 RepID=A0A1J1HYC7_9DIPT|nr:CLUMA_CG006641, isoform A [Clunio marinus]
MMTFIKIILTISKIPFHALKLSEIIAYILKFSSLIFDSDTKYCVGIKREFVQPYWVEILKNWRWGSSTWGASNYANA